MTANFQFLEIPERYLPVKLSLLRERILRDGRLSAVQREQIGGIFEMAAARFHFEFYRKLEHLKAVYDRFDPDTETPLLSDDGDELARREEFIRAYEQLLLEGNYVEMPHGQIIACVEHQSQTGVRVRANLSDYADLRVFYRGIHREQRTFRPWQTPWKQAGETVHVFSRVAVLVRLKRRSPQFVYLKLFKNVVAEDLEMLLPYVKTRMRLFDQLKIGTSVLGGVATALVKLFTAVVLSPWLFLLLLSGFVTAITRGVFSFFSSQMRYMQTLTANLYFRNLANNGSLLAHLVDTAEGEECKEMWLAYYLLYVERDRNYTRQGLDRRIEQWFQAEFGREIDFEVGDALRKLHALGLLDGGSPEMPKPDDVLTVCEPAEALRRLDEVWDGYFPYHEPDASRG
ncbi:MAG: DUF3754 domain-containing protein [Pirellulales bacterium]|nr:DUF3754 domain-containing protein [Pirellulales bacterium]